MRSPSQQRAPRAVRGAVELLIGTRKGAFRLKSDKDRKAWKLRGPDYLGQIIQHVVLDPRDKKTMLIAARPGHLGPSLFRSEDAGKTWKEAKKPPAFAKAKEGERARTVHHTFWLQAGHESEPGTWFAGTSPPALFKSTDGGDTWKSVKGFNECAENVHWIPPAEQAPPDGATMHSLQIDPADPKHMFVAASAGGVFETTNGGRKWKPINKGVAMDFSPEEDPEYGHDPHCFGMHQMDPNRLWHQNHCGIYRMDRVAGEPDRWERVGDNMPKKVGDIGFPIVLHPRDPDTVWVFPMDGSSVWPRVSPGGKPAAYMTNDAGKTWKRQDRGFPQEQGWFTVKRQCMSQDSHDPLGVYLGTTSGEIWASTNEGKKWTCIVRHLPHIYSVEVAGQQQ
ncbi:MAG: photosystem II stability/assembly factor-like uncharacterized protein [Planctomycetota bacterium]|jgi:photosystem II stability/assembly factor-like uncharacterized protein